MPAARTRWPPNDMSAAPGTPAPILLTRDLIRACPPTHDVPEWPLPGLSAPQQTRPLTSIGASILSTSGAHATSRRTSGIAHPQVSIVVTSAVPSNAGSEQSGCLFLEQTSGVRQTGPRRLRVSVVVVWQRCSSDRIECVVIGGGRAGVGCRTSAIRFRRSSSADDTAGPVELGMRRSQRQGA